VAEATRLAHELGTGGVFGGQMEVKGATGVWRELTDDLNVMSQNLTLQVRTIKMVTKAVYQGEFENAIILPAQGEMARCSRELGQESKLAGQIDLPGAENTWRDLVSSVNLTSDTLTVQLRSLKDAALAAVDGDSSRRITVEAQGEMKELRDALNILIERSASPG
jgi:methyl-accepting chemotaxis protein